ncbi:hypothetical protein [Noviherbaspirillum sp. UKPF54]|uniref:hypothetical protein n=1 Tax=Noviherbaspirillum sp. UKPF54 TaxID=2601898 RepID=UPI0011B174AE|nr:hypothetical protein [Noviherbaspirillum sp. UKPF54]QDZ27037.1 hypothetical protein FAY22_03110 [Noviherbaspirillum sp. UKPF54]
MIADAMLSPLMAKPPQTSLSGNFRMTVLVHEPALIVTPSRIAAMTGCGGFVQAQCSRGGLGKTYADQGSLGCGPAVRRWQKEDAAQQDFISVIFTARGKSYNLP